MTHTPRGTPAPTQTPLPVPIRLRALRTARVACFAMLVALLAAAGCATSGPRRGGPAVAADHPPAPADPSDRLPSLPANPASLRPRPNDPKPFNPDLGELQRRDTPPFYYEDMTVRHLLEFVPRAYRQKWIKRRERWNEPAQEEIGQWEGRGVALQGYVTSVRPRGGGLELTVGEFPDDTPNKTVLTVITRPYMALHRGWTLNRLRRLAHDRARFRLSGWLLYDNTAASEIGRQRGTLWEVHPVTKLEIWDGRDWWEPG